MIKTPKMLELEARYGKDIAQIIKEAWEQRGCLAHIRLGIGNSTLYRWLVILGLERTKRTIQPRADGSS